MEDYYQAKASLFTPERAARGVVCVDDSWGRRLAKEASVPVLTVSSRSDVGADWEIQTHGGDPSAFELVGEGQRLSLRSALPGDFNRVNTAVAAVVLLASGYAADAVIRALAAIPSVPGRMERVLVDDVDQSSMPLAVVDFAHTPDAVAAALKALRLHTSGALIVVLGAGGDRDSGKREAMGAAAAANADFVLVTDDNPRSEDPASIRAALLAGAAGSAHLSPDRVREIGDRAAAIGVAVDLASVGDTIAVLGRGHEVDQDIGGVIHPFDDRVELKAALRQFSAKTHKKLREYTALSEHTAGGHADGHAMPGPDGGDPQ
jgi:UDP-N-acetylmuramoyl-L-alanyl-D-glutamate--2,6-diaminopimelate ligase